MGNVTDDCMDCIRERWKWEYYFRQPPPSHFPRPSSQKKEMRERKEESREQSGRVRQEKWKRKIEERAEKESWKRERVREEK